ncbi:hypothetical protein GXSOP10_1174 [Armatimonadetes bacterium GXS]|jgi:hypothetical protein|nr:hypothetical protein GXSOP10_1174 [Armatimonadetes bacterium GXS]
MSVRRLARDTILKAVSTPWGALGMIAWFHSLLTGWLVPAVGLLADWAVKTERLWDSSTRQQIGWFLAGCFTGSAIGWLENAVFQVAPNIGTGFLMIVAGYAVVEESRQRKHHRVSLFRASFLACWVASYFALRLYRMY